MNADVIYAAFGVAALSLTIAKSPLFEPLRSLADKLSHEWLGELFSCFYCLSHWIALGVALYLVGPGLPALGLAFALVGMSAIIGGVIIKLLLWHEQEIRELKESLRKIAEG